MKNICVRCGAPIEPWPLTEDWQIHSEGQVVWIRSEHSNEHLRGEAICDFVPNKMPETGWTADQFHMPLDADTIRADLRAIEADLR